ncbi:hypothetical protein Sme01_18260 [Sphaerisporangium melleum]|uniref:HTH cro/C1-type domain-containing protein n=1 Tax=Sphaerisporangium melleum TaxID=321316 RepID=A0A917RN17_9ACTN|nr:helix-turn-helix transcriptional regulator [Sphaerisporangium melleum]GGL14506.1 hypothetical protein GCM10007964_65620 [Sphaerisporangium melleum]GII69350.1 hypothetical protein Sme01_18260 [Sphaerisporangium melleum]
MRSARDSGGLGRRIAAIRRARRMSQADLAQASAVSLSMIRKIEQGGRNPSDAIMDAITSALGVDPAHLLGGGNRLDGRVHQSIPTIRMLIAAHEFPDDGPVRPVPLLRTAVEELVVLRLNAQYVRLSHTLPDLLAELIRGLHSGGDLPRDLAPLLVATCRSADAVAYKYRYLDLSARLIDLMRATATAAGDPLLRASTAYVQTETFFAARAYQAGLRALEAEIDRLGPGRSPRHLGVLGALHMRAAVIAARTAAPDAATRHLAEARRLGDLVPEGIYHGTAFGPSSVRIHEVSVAVGLGRLQPALELAATWTPPDEMPAERRSGFHIEVARAQLWAGRPAAAFQSLRMARRIAPLHTREHQWVREDVESLLRLHRSPGEALIGFAEWVGVT